MRPRPLRTSLAVLVLAGALCVTGSHPLRGQDLARPPARATVSFVIAGKVTDATGAGVAGAVVRTGSPASSRVTTIVGGWFEIQGTAPEGSVMVCVESAPAGFAATCQRSPRALALVAARGAVQRLTQDLVLGKSARLVVEVADPDGVLPGGRAARPAAALRLFVVTEMGMVMPVNSGPGATPSQGNSRLFELQWPSGEPLRLMHMNQQIALETPEKERWLANTRRPFVMPAAGDASIRFIARAE